MSTNIIRIIIICFLVLSCESAKESGVRPESKVSGINPLEELELIDVDVKDGMVEKVTGRIEKLQNFECIDCHDTKKKTWSLEALKEDGSHDDILNIYKHANKETMDCMACHSLNDRNNLHLLNGKKVSFDESFKLCAQCHTNKFKDWRNGAHGKRLGFWKGDKVYRNCADCHNPHYPASAFPQRKPVVDALLIRDELKSLATGDGHGGVSKKTHESQSKETHTAFTAKSFFASQCAKCHGDNGQGINGKKNKPAINKLADSDADVLFKKIKDGYKGDLGKMPGFAKKASDEELKKLVEFVKSLNN